MALGLSDRARRGRPIVPLLAVAGAMVLAGGCFLGTDPVRYPGIGVPLDVADLNGDGHLDIVSCSGALLNDGTGAFPTAVPGVAPACGTDAATGDVDGDGHVDRVVLWDDHVAGQRISLYPGDGTGRFGAEAWALGDIFSVASAVAVGDLNGDGRTDIVFETFQPGDVYPQGYQVLLAVDGPERFAAPVSYSDGMAGAAFSAQSLVLRDIDGDGDLDLVTVGFSEPGKPEAGFVVVALNDGTGSFPGATSHPVTPPGGRFTAAGVGGPAILDVDGNGTLDIVATTTFVDEAGVGTTCLAVLRGDGTGAFQPYDCLPAPAGNYGSLGEGPNVADFDHDGHQDLLTTNGVLQGDGNGGFPVFTAFGLGDDALTADVDGDGRPDAVQSTLFETGATAVHVYLNRL